MDVDLLVEQGVDRFVGVAEQPALAFSARGHLCKVIDPEYDVLRRHHDGHARRGTQKVVGRKHEQAAFNLGLEGKGHVHGHLVSVEVRVERGAHERMEADGLPFDKDREKRLYAQPVQRGRAV